MEPNQSATRPRSIGSAIGGVFLGLLIAAMGGIFTGFLWHGYQRAMETREWTEVKATIESSEIAEEDSATGKRFTPLVSYTYVFGDRLYLGNEIRRVKYTTKDENKANRIIEKYPPGAEVACWVCPDDPERTVLAHETKAVLYTIWFPVLFVVAGLGIAFQSVRGYLIAPKA